VAVTRVCTVCAHEQRPAIDAALIRGQPMSALAAHYSVSPDALSRHNAGHVPEHVAKARATEEVGQAITGSARLFLAPVRGTERL
jgi:hypothetical protein